MSFALPLLSHSSPSLETQGVVFEYRNQTSILDLQSNGNQTIPNINEFLEKS